MSLRLRFVYAGLVKKAVVILAVQPQACSTSCYAISIAICVVIAFGFVAVFFYLADFYALHGGKWKLVPYKDDPVRPTSRL